MSNIAGRRFERLFGSDGRSVVVAMDHGTTDGALAGFENPGTVLEQVIAGGADAILTSIGIARHFSKQLKDTGLLIRCDGATSPLLERPRELVLGIEDILTSGADAAANAELESVELDPVLIFRSRHRAFDGAVFHVDSHSRPPSRAGISGGSVNRISKS